jgi:hypothetical protein
LVVIAVVILLVTSGRPAVRMIRGVVRPSAGDRAAGFLALAVRSLPADRVAWGQAMLVELDQAQGKRGRWGFSLGCIRAAAAMRVRASLGPGDRGAASTRRVLLGMVGAGVGLAVYGIVRYPAGAGAETWVVGPVVLAILGSYAGCLLTLSRERTPPAVGALRRGLVGGLVVGAGWLVVLAPTHLGTWVLSPLSIVLLCPASVTALTVRAGGDGRAARGAALWSGLVGGLLVFVVGASASYVSDGRPYDAQLLRDFHRSGVHDLAAYAVRGNLDSGIGLLVLIPVVCVAFGSLGRHERAGRRAR